MTGPEEGTLEIGQLPEHLRDCAEDDVACQLEALQHRARVLEGIAEEASWVADGTLWLIVGATLCALLGNALSLLARAHNDTHAAVDTSGVTSILRKNASVIGLGVGIAVAIAIAAGHFAVLAFCVFAGVLLALIGLAFDSNLLPDIRPLRTLPERLKQMAKEVGLDNFGLFLRLTSAIFTLGVLIWTVAL